MARYCIGQCEVGEHSVVIELEEVMLTSWEYFRDDGQELPHLHDSWLLQGKAKAVEPFRRYYNMLRDQGVTTAQQLCWLAFMTNMGYECVHYSNSA